MKINKGKFFFVPCRVPWFCFVVIFISSSSVGFWFCFQSQSRGCHILSREKRGQRWPPTFTDLFLSEFPSSISVLFFPIVTFLWLKGGAKENESVASKYLMNFVIVFFHDHTRKDYLHVHSGHAQMKPIFYSMDNLTNKEINCEKWLIDNKLLRVKASSVWLLHFGNPSCLWRKTIVVRNTNWERLMGKYLNERICRTWLGVRSHVIEPELGPQYSDNSDNFSRFKSVTICVRRVNRSRMVQVVAALK